MRILLALAITMFLPAFALAQEAQPAIQADHPYLACGCGCCGGENAPEPVCLYRSKGDDMQTVVETDTQEKNSEDCAVKGCSRGKLYSYCD